jgi:hypothetical protein
MNQPRFLLTWRLSFTAAVVAAGVFAALPVSSALAGTTIGNTPPWNGSTITSGFGVSGAPNYFTPNYGQTVTVPPTDTRLDSFTFYVDLPTNLIFRGEVYAWDPTTVGDPFTNPYGMGNATGPALYESGQMHTTSYGSGFAIQPITFNIPGGLPLTADAQFVLFITTSRDNAANAGITATGFAGYTPTDTYTDGDWVYLDDGGNPSQWTTVPWVHPALFADIFFQDDLAFTASFSSHAACQPGSKANLRWHYSANGSSGGWSGTQTQSCGSTFTMGPQAMEGNQTVKPGTVISAGFDFTLPGNNTLHTVTFSDAQVTFPVVCAGGATPLQQSFTISLGSPSYTAPDSKWYPSGQQSSSLVYQGSYTVPMTLCTGGGAIILGQGGSQGGGTFSATLGIS